MSKDSSGRNKGGAGKGDASRVSNQKLYRDNLERIYGKKNGESK